ncbi:MAG: Lrp/AsnC ligand binding domain-containing protein [Bacteroidia bacterium]
MFLEDASFYTKVVKQLERIPEITEIHYTTGRYSIFLKIVSKNTRGLRNILNEKFSQLWIADRNLYLLEESLKTSNIKVLDDE